MATSLVSLVVQSRSIGRHIGRMNEQMALKGIEVSTGKKTDIVQELGGEIRNYLDLKSVHSSLYNRTERLRTGDNRLAQMGISLETIGMQAREFNDMTSQIGLIDRSNIDVYSEKADSVMQSMKNSLNVQWGGRYLFSGDEVLEPAMKEFDDLKTAVAGIMETHRLNAGGTFTTQAQIDAMVTEIDTVFDNTHATAKYNDLIYTGGAGQMAGIEIADNDVMGFNVKANNDAFKQMAQGLVMLSLSKNLRAGFSDSNNRATNNLEEHYLKETVTMLAEANNNVISLQASIGFKQERIKHASEGIEQTIFHYEERIGLFENADQYKSGIAFSELQRQLEASYYVTARLGDQSLLKYLS